LKIDVSEALLARAQEWLEEDPDPLTQAELLGLLRHGDGAGLRERFGSELHFGTAGLRALLGAGPARLNVMTVAKASYGVAQQLLEDHPDARIRGVVVGRDARRMSPELARVAARVFLGQGLRVHWVEVPTPTPVLAFAVRHLSAVGAVVVTASHNPPDYNGFKVFDARGQQIVPPIDARIRQLMSEAPPMGKLPRRALDDAQADGDLRLPGTALEEAFLEALDEQCLGPVPPPAQPRVVTTALHGVGQRWLSAALARRGFQDVHPVPEQAEPDPRFPTVAFPNPEEPGALDLSLALATRLEADLVLANDPDADRLAVAVRRRGGYRVLNGNEVGVLLADWILSELTRQHRLPHRPLVVSTVVSTTLLARVAAAHRAVADEVLTGFKWIWERAAGRTAEGYQMVFGFEEALGYSVGPVVRDKDGLGAAQVVMELAASLKARGQTLIDRLDSLAVVHGVHVTSQVNKILPGLEGRAAMARVIEGLRAKPPASIAGQPVVKARDLRGPDADHLGLPRDDVLTWWLADGSRIVLRPSGTEPKLKAYLEARAEVAGAADLDAARERAQGRLRTLEAWVSDVIG
jgi:phosphomannomutase